MTMSTKLYFDVGFGKVTYEPGAPKSLPRWVWACRCEQCADTGVFHGPFRTLREAERDAEEAVTLIAAGDDGVHH